MRKFLSILTLLLLTSCVGLKYSTEYKREFPQDQKELSYEVAYNFLWVADLDSIPIEDWILTQQETKCGYKIERSILLKPAYKTEYLLIHTTNIRCDTIFYEFEILNKTNLNFKK